MERSGCSSYFWICTRSEGNEQLCLHPALQEALSQEGVQLKHLNTLLVKGQGCLDVSTLLTVTTSLIWAASTCNLEVYDIDLLIDCAIGIDEGRILPFLRVASLATLRRCDQEHTHLFRPPGESFTPYKQLHRIMTLVPTNGRFADLGCGNGRAAILVHVCRPDINYYGYEGVQGRLRLCKKAIRELGGNRHIRLFHQWLGQYSTFPLNRISRRSGLLIYMFNPFAPSTLRQVLMQLRWFADCNDFTLVMKSMRHSMQDVKAEWEALRSQLEAVSSRYTGLDKADFSVYRTRKHRHEVLKPPRGERSTPAHARALRRRNADS